MIGLAWALPSTVVGPLTGVPIDRYGAKRVLLGAYVVGVGAAVGLSFTTTFSQLIGVGVVLGVVKAFAQPAADSLPPRLVDDADLLAANALLGASSESAIVFGPLVAGLAIAAWGLRGAFLVDAATYLVGMAVVAPLRLRPRESPPVPAGTGWRAVAAEVREGLALVAKVPVLRFTMAMSALVFVTWSTFVVVEPIYVRDVLGRPASFFALLQTVFGVGLVGMGLALPRLGDRVAGPRALAASVLLSGVTAALYVGTRLPAVAMFGVFLWGIDVAFFSAPSRTLLQRHSPPAAHGRVLSLYRTSHSAADVVALPLAGLAAGLVGVQATALTVSVLPLVAGAVGLRLARRLPVGGAVEGAGGEPEVVPLETPLESPAA